VTNTVEAVIGNLVESVKKSLDNISESLKNKIENFDMDLSDVDISQFENIVNLLGNANK
jgi:hypothetical protein